MKGTGTTAAAVAVAIDIERGIEEIDTGTTRTGIEEEEERGKEAGMVMRDEEEVVTMEIGRDIRREVTIIDIATGVLMKGLTRGPGMRERRASYDEFKKCFSVSKLQTHWALMSPNPNPHFIMKRKKNI